MNNMEQLRASTLTLMTRYIGSSHQPTPKCSHNLVLPLATGQKESERVKDCRKEHRAYVICEILPRKRLVKNKTLSCYETNKTMLCFLIKNSASVG